MEVVVETGGLQAVAEQRHLKLRRASPFYASTSHPSALRDSPHFSMSLRRWIKERQAVS